MDEGQSNLEKLLSSFPEGSEFWNEAQNRFQFIDTLLTECLGWEKPYIEVEVHDTSDGRVDYLLGKPVKAALEAKREAVKFDLLPGTNPTRPRRLKPLVESCKNLKEAFNQVIPYCIMNGAQTAIICNGPQLLLFQAFITEKSPLEGEAYVFNGFSEYQKYFAQLWKLLSPEGINERWAIKRINKHNYIKLPVKASSQISNLSEYKYRSDFQENLRSLASILLDEINENHEVLSEFYKECYVPIEANNRHLLLSKNIIKNRYKRVNSNGSNPIKTEAKINDGKLEVENGEQSSAYKTSPIVVVGDVGVGKTSFFKNLFQMVNEEKNSNTLFVHLNLGEKATLSENLKTFILTELPRVLKKEYKIDITKNSLVEKIYKNELLDFDHSVSGQIRKFNEEKYQIAKIEFLKNKLDNNSEHLHASLSYLNEFQNKQIIIVIDNADQRNFETQQEAFLIAQELASSGNALVFVSLRPSTFYQSKLTGAMSGYENRLLTISPPPADEVIKRRLTFAVRVAEGKIAPAVLKNVKLNLNNIVLFLNATLRSIKSNNEIKKFLSNITGGNTRLVIELISSFCGSPNVEAEKIVSIEKEFGDYQVPFHEFTKHALLGEYAYYNPLSSLVAFNLFDISMGSPREHFLSSLIIAFISSPNGKKDNDGFISADLILEEMKKYQFVDDQTRHSLRVLAKKRLIETPFAHYRENEVSNDTLPDEFDFRATSIGLYHIRYWVGEFSYLDAMSIDTPIFEENVRDKIITLASENDISKRFERAKSFKQYLEDSWNEQIFNCDYYDLTSVLNSREKSFEVVKSAINKINKKRRFISRPI